MKLKRAESPAGGGTTYVFFCPGCKDHHQVWVGQPGRPSWEFNGDMGRPTFSPSLLITTGCKTSRHKPGDNCWCTYNAENPDQPAPFKCERCHSFVRDGRIQFLTDCTHALAGQTVDLPDLPNGESECRRS